MTSINGVPLESWSHDMLMGMAEGVAFNTPWSPARVTCEDGHWAITFRHERDIFTCVNLDDQVTCNAQSRVMVLGLFRNALERVPFARFDHGSPRPTARLDIYAFGDGRSMLEVEDFEPGMTFLLKAVDHGRGELVLELRDGWPWRDQKEPPCP